MQKEQKTDLQKEQKADLQKEQKADLQKRVKGQPKDPGNLHYKTSYWLNKLSQR